MGSLNDKEEKSDTKDHCASKSSDNKCLSCEYEYYLSGGSCLGCPKGCRTCNSLDCYSCITGYRMSMQRCFEIECNENCEKCELGKCITCKSGYFGENCEKSCGSSCKECTKNGCLTCSKKHYRKDGYCEKCPKGCSECPSGNCTSCENYYYLEGDVCIYNKALVYGLAIGIPVGIIALIVVISILCCCGCCCKKKVILNPQPVAVCENSPNNQNANNQQSNAYQVYPNSSFYPVYPAYQAYPDSTITTRELGMYKTRENNEPLSNPVKIKVSFITGKKISVDTYKNELLGAVVARIEDMNVNLNLYSTMVYGFWMCSVNGKPLDLNKTIEQNNINENTVVNYMVKQK